MSLEIRPDRRAGSTELVSSHACSSPAAKPDGPPRKGTKLTRPDVDDDVAAAPDEGDTSEDVPAARSGRRLPASGRTLLVAVASLALGVAITAGISAVRGNDGAAPAAGETTTTELPIGEPVDVPAITGTVEPGAPADSPEAAVTAFLDAELAGDFTASYLLLSATDREEYRTPAGWVASHADVLPPVTGYEVEDLAADDSRATIVTVTGFEPSLDQVVGLVPERARATWVAVAEDGGWAVALSESNFEPLHPPDAEATAAVQAWVRSHQECRPDGEHSPVLGLPALALALCDTDGPVRVGEVERFTEGFDTNTFLAAYGAPVLEWARVVPVEGPVELRAVVAPIGRQWTVIGVLDSRTLR